IRDSVAVSLTNLDHGMVSVDAARGNIGARLNVIESTLTDNEDVALVNKSVQADLRELDYAEALSRLSFQTIILEAAQQSYVKISSLNLFNSMRRTDKRGGAQKTPRHGLTWRCGRLDWTARGARMYRAETHST